MPAFSPPLADNLSHDATDQAVGRLVDERLGVPGGADARIVALAFVRSENNRIVKALAHEPPGGCRITAQAPALASLMRSVRVRQGA
jgi:hypothetical protein